MAAPLRSANPGPQKSMQFAHFGVLDAGTQGKGSMLVSLFVNAIAGLVIIVLSAAAAKQAIQKNRMLTELIEPVVAKKVEPVKPKPLPPKPKLPEIAKVEEPKIVVPRIKPPDMPKPPPIVKMDEPKPIIAPAAPKRIIAMAAPVAVSLAHPQAASVPNNDPHPSAVRLGNTTSPLNNLKGPAVATVNLSAGMPGMNSANTGNGPRASTVVLGNGSPQSTTIKGNGVVAVAGIPHGVPNGTGTGQPTGQQVSLGQAPPPPAPKPAVAADVHGGSTPTLIYKPKPAYTDEARQAHIEGVITVHIRVLPTGQVEVLGLANRLGHGLDEAAMRAAEGTKFKPATDPSGRPILWDGYVTVAFQLAG